MTSCHRSLAVHPSPFGFLRNAFSLVFLLVVHQKETCRHYYALDPSYQHELQNATFPPEGQVYK